MTHGFRDIHVLFAELNRPTQPPLNAPLPEPQPNGEPEDIDIAQLAQEQAPDPRVLDWSCTEFTNPDGHGFNLNLLVVPPGEHQVELWFAPMTAEDEGQVRELLAELGDHNAIAWAGTLPDPVEVAEVIDRAAHTIADKALAATGLPVGQLTDAYQPALTAARSNIITLLEHAAEQGWTASRTVEAWELYCHDVDPVPR